MCSVNLSFLVIVSKEYKYCIGNEIKYEMYFDIFTGLIGIQL